MDIQNKQDGEQKNVRHSSKEDVVAAVSAAYGVSPSQIAGIVPDIKSESNGIPSDRNIKQKPMKRNSGGTASKPKVPVKADLGQNVITDAKQVKSISEKNPDRDIMVYVNEINGKILREANSGGFSTNIKFRVTPQNWVNVKHIQEWYIQRGFEVLNYEMSTPPYGTSGAMEHDFTISWVNAN